MLKLEPVVFVVDDDRRVADSVQMLVHANGHECQLFSSAEALLHSYPANRPGCVVVDLRLPGMSGIDLLERRPTVPVRHPAVVLTGYGDVPSVVRATKAGAIAFVEKPFVPDVLLRHINDALELDQAAREEQTRRGEILGRLASLTTRERQVLEMIVLGRSNKEIARLLKRSQKTVEVHRTHVMKKMHAGNVADLVRLSVGECAIELPPLEDAASQSIAQPKGLVNPF